MTTPPVARSFDISSTSVSSLQNFLQHTPDVTVRQALTLMMPHMPGFSVSMLEDVLVANAFEVSHIHVAGLDDAELKLAVRIFTIEHPYAVCYPFNDAFYDKNRSPQLLESFAPYAKLLMRAAHCLLGQAQHVYEGAAYRGLKLSNNAELKRKFDDYTNCFVVGALMTIPAFMSVSLDDKVADGFGDHVLLQFTCVRGVRISALSAYPNEAEVCVPPPSVYRIVNVAMFKGSLVITLESVLSPLTYLAPPSAQHARPRLSMQPCAPMSAIPTRCVLHNGYYYKSLAGHDPSSHQVVARGTASRDVLYALPLGWELCPNTPDAVLVCSQNPWGNDALVLQDGQAIWTAHAENPGSSAGSRKLSQESDRFGAGTVFVRTNTRSMGPGSAFISMPGAADVLLRLSMQPCAALTAIPARCVLHNGYYYKSLAGHDPSSHQVVARGTASRDVLYALPLGWELCPNTPDAVLVCSQNPWGNDALVLQDGQAIWTAHAENPGSSAGSRKLSQESGRFGAGTVFVRTNTRSMGPGSAFISMPGAADVLLRRSA